MWQECATVPYGLRADRRMNHAETFFAAAAQICHEISFASIEALAAGNSHMGEGNWAVAPTLTSMPVGESTMAEAAIETASLSAPRATCCGLRSTRLESMPMDDGALGINAYLGAALGLLTGSRG